MITLGAGEDVCSREVSAAGWSVNWKEKLATFNEGKDEDYSMNELHILVYTQNSCNCSQAEMNKNIHCNSL